MTAADRRAWIDAIRAAPEDDVKRLAYADALDETGEAQDAARAEFIRGQLADRVSTPRLTFLIAYEGVLGSQPHQMRREAGPGWCAAESGDRSARWERGMLRLVAGPLSAFLHLTPCGCRSGGIAPTAPTALTTCRTCRGTGNATAPTVRLTQLVQREPVRSVLLTDERPVPFESRHGPGGFAWPFYRFVPAGSPVLAMHATEAAADAAMSDLLIGLALAAPVPA